MLACIRRLAPDNAFQTCILRCSQRAYGLPLAVQERQQPRYPAEHPGAAGGAANVRGHPQHRGLWCACLRGLARLTGLKAARCPTSVIFWCHFRLSIFCRDDVSGGNADVVSLSQLVPAKQRATPAHGLVVPETRELVQS